MPQFKVQQIVQCEVNVWYVIEAKNQTDAEKMVKTISTPTCAEGCDYEIVNDSEIL